MFTPQVNSGFEDFRIDEKLWAEKGHFSKDQFHFVYSLVEDLHPTYALETGFHTGRSSYAVLEAGKTTLKKMMSIDIDLDNSPLGRKQKDILELHYKDNNFKVIEACSHETFNSSFFELNFPEGIDFMMVDGDHTYEGCLQDISLVLPHITKGGIIIVDDYKSGPPEGCVIEDVSRACDFVNSIQQNLSKQEWNHRGKGFCVFTKVGGSTPFPDQ
jgi:predicted O-methyltransferase YrrM